MNHCPSRSLMLSSEKAEGVLPTQQFHKPRSRHGRQKMCLTLTCLIAASLTISTWTSYWWRNNPSADAQMCPTIREGDNPEIIWDGVSTNALLSQTRSDTHVTVSLFPAPWARTSAGAPATMPSYSVQSCRYAVGGARPLDSFELSVGSSRLSCGRGAERHYRFNQVSSQHFSK